MFISDIKRVVEQVSRDKGIDREVLIKALEEALKSAARKKFGSKMDIEVQYNEESGEIEVFQFKEVAAVVTEPEIEISLEEGRKLDPDCEVTLFYMDMRDQVREGHAYQRRAREAGVRMVRARPSALEIGYSRR